ncbi:hypothetical protein AALP_AA5G248500 [Arabis alpina]|uniref:Uncharacterized protein n=1 Tax=Arabis alpina TaxID=50452 RepID=A0A087GZ65_ARAAL|nr:hypothetical protein AALP_AA5G248500 [Arabis alpina]
MLLTIRTSPVINRRTSSPVERGLGLGYKSCLSYDLLFPPSRSLPPVNCLLLQAIDACLCVVTRRFTSTGLLPKPPDQPLVKPYEPPQPPKWPDPPDPPPDPPPKSEQRASLPQLETKNHHSSNPSPPLHIRWVLTLSHPPWLTLQGLTSGLSKSPSIELPSDANPQPSMCWWSSISLVFPTTMELTLRSPTLKPDVQPLHRCSTTPVVQKILTNGPVPELPDPTTTSTLLLGLSNPTQPNPPPPKLPDPPPYMSPASPLSTSINHKSSDIASLIHHQRQGLGSIRPKPATRPPLVLAWVLAGRRRSCRVPRSCRKSLPIQAS